MKEAKFWKAEKGRVRCGLCPHSCLIAEGKRGICGVRENRGGTLYSLIYGKASSIHVDPIEKKPLFHFKPGEMVLSLGTVGCNFRCEHCQNFAISQADADSPLLREMRAEEIPRLCTLEGCGGVAWTYNEPTIWHEFTLDSSRLAKERGLFTVYVTNGYIQEEPLKEIARYLDGMNIDIKAFREDFYRKVCKAHLEPVLRAAELAYRLAVHVELTYLIIPTMNDSTEEITEFTRWVCDHLSPDVPVHFTRFHPDYKMLNLQSTPMETMNMAYDIALREGLRFVYLGNVPYSSRENTYCPSCGALVVERMGYRILTKGLRGDRCASCGEALNIVP